MNWKEGELLEYFLELEKTQDRLSGTLDYKASLRNMHEMNKLKVLNADEDKHVEKLKSKYSKEKNGYYSKLLNYQKEGKQENEREWSECEQVISRIESKKLGESAAKMHDEEDYKAMRKREKDEKQKNKKLKLETIEKAQQRDQELAQKMLEAVEHSLQTEEKLLHILEEDKTEKKEDRKLKAYTLLSKNPELKNDPFYVSSKVDYLQFMRLNFYLVLFCGVCNSFQTTTRIRKRVTKKKI